MEAERISDSLSRLFQVNRIVFWQDADGEFQDSIAQIEINGVEVIDTGSRAPLDIKIDVELERPTGKFLIYAMGERPLSEKDWLLDIRHYAAPFSADRASLIARDLDLAHASMREHVAARSKFFASKDRIEKLSRLIDSRDTPTAVDMKITAVLLKTDQWDFHHVLMVLGQQLAQNHDLSAVPEVFADFEKYGVDEMFWDQCRSYFGFDTEKPTLERLLISLLVSDFGKTLNGSTPTALHHLLLPQKGMANAVVFLDRWRDSTSFHESYDVISSLVSDVVDIEKHLTGIEPEVLRDSKTFLATEKEVARQLTRRVTDSGSAVDAAEIAALASTRQNAYWANPRWGNTDDAPRAALGKVYDALVHAAELFRLRQEYSAGFDHPNARAFWNSYENELYQFDQLYRLFCECADEIEVQGWDVLKGLRSAVEDVYCNGYVTPLALSWGKHVESMIKDEWRVDSVERQSRFFNAHVAPQLNKGSERRVFVIISDAFRYEAAKELETELNGKYRMSAKLTSQLSVLPSYTALGMASLLPHTDLSVAKDGNILVDGKSSAGLESRGKILAEHAGVAVKADELMAMRKDAGRAFLEGKQVVYIYHNVIDQTADTGNEEGTFQAVRKTIDGIAALVRHIVNSLNGSNVIITADHGFLYQESAPTAVDKNSIETKPAGSVRAKKRYVIGDKLGDDPGAWHGKMATTSDVKGDAEFWVPKGTNRFHFVGGARFLHGGAMLQEICVPIIKVRQHKDGKAKEATKVSNVGVTLLSPPTKITTSRQRITLLQTEPVTDRRKPAKVRVGVYESGQPVSSVETITLESTTSQMNEDWKKEVWLTLGSQSYNKSRKYTVIVRDAENDSEVVRQDVIIDLAFTNDF